MWMMGYNDGGEFNSNLQDSFNGRKLRPLMPRQAASHLLTLNHHLAMAEQNKRESSTQQVVVSSRWNPTPEQLHTLEELYRSGTRTPSADQIQHITAQLRRYGKIEGKNVFYWFQNHKARERQKRRRHLQSPSDQPPPNTTTPVHEKYGENVKELSPGSNRTVFEVEDTKKWASPTNSSTMAEKNVSTKGAAKAAAAAADAECKADGWLQFGDETELQQRRNATWHMMHLSCSSSPTNLINSSSVRTVTTSTVPSPVRTILDEPDHLIKTRDFIHNIFVDPIYNIVQNLDRYSADGGGGGGGGGNGAQTLQLFPLGRNEESCCDDHEKEEEEESGAGILDGTSSSVASNDYQFFEFLPLKN